MNGGVGADTLDGGAGLDTADYSTAGSGILVNLDSGFTSRGEAAGDTLISIENVTGSAFDDIIVGANDESNVLSGGAGNDTLFGLGGDDTFLFDSEFGNDTIEDFSEGDLLDVSALGILDLSQLSVTQEGANTIIRANIDGQLDAENSIVLTGVDAATIDAADFVFTLDDAGTGAVSSLVSFDGAGFDGPFSRADISAVDEQASLAEIALFDTDAFISNSGLFDFDLA